MFYSWRDHTGEHWYLVNPSLRVKKALNDQVTVVNITKDHKNLRFAVDSTRYSWSIGTETLTALGRYRVAQDSLMTKDEEVDVGRMVSRGFRSPVAADAMADAKG